jgi:hypothetical protein
VRRLLVLTFGSDVGMANLAVYTWIFQVEKVQRTCRGDLNDFRSVERAVIFKDVGGLSPLSA